MNKQDLIRHLNTKSGLISFYHYNNKIDDVSDLLDDEFLLSNFNKNYIFMGLNPSRNLRGDYTNFHDSGKRSKDKRLREILLRFPQFECCLMMDLYSVVNPDSLQIKNKEEDVRNTLNYLKPLLDGGSKIIAIGTKVFKELSKKKYALIPNKNLFYMPHYSQGVLPSKEWQKRIEDCLKKAIQ